jgi:two-component system, sensor histidine kinase ChiS
MKVLVVDDDKLILEAIAHILEADGYEVVVAEDSCKAISIIENGDINLIVSDIMMPNMSGLELLNLLNEFYFNKVPVIFISSLYKSDIISCCKALGAKEFIVKPIDFKKLSFSVKKYAK